MQQQQQDMRQSKRAAATADESDSLSLRALTVVVDCNDRLVACHNRGLSSTPFVDSVVHFQCDTQRSG